MLEFVDAPHQGPRDTEKTRRNELGEAAGGNAKTKAQPASSNDGPCKDEPGKEDSGPESNLWPRWVPKGEVDGWQPRKGSVVMKLMGGTWEKK